MNKPNPLLEIPSFLDRKINPAVELGRATHERVERKMSKPRKRGPKWKSKATLNALRKLGWSEHMIRSFSTEMASLVIAKDIQAPTRPQWKEPDDGM